MYFSWWVPVMVPTILLVLLSPCTILIIIHTTIRPVDSRPNVWGSSAFVATTWLVGLLHEAPNTNFQFKVSRRSLTVLSWFFKFLAAEARPQWSTKLLKLLSVLVSDSCDGHIIVCLNFVRKTLLISAFTISSISVLQILTDEVEVYTKILNSFGFCVILPYIVATVVFSFVFFALPQSSYIIC